MKMYWHSEHLAKVINQDFVAVVFTRQERFTSWAESPLLHLSIFGPPIVKIVFLIS